MEQKTALSDGEIEALRLRAKRRLYTVFVLTGLCYLLFLGFTIWEEFVSLPSHIYTAQHSMLEKVFLVAVAPAVLAVGAFFLFFWIISNRSYDRFSEVFKNRYVLSTVRETGLFEDLSYRPKDGFSYDEIRRCGVVNSGMERYFASEDMLAGVYQNTRFQYSDVTTKRLVKTGKNAHVDTIFQGQVMRFSIFDDRKTSDGYLQIFQKDLLWNLKGWTADHKIETENAAFNSKFQVYADDEHNAFYILAPAVMEKIMAFQEQMGEQIAIAFQGPVMYVAINRTLSLFDPSVDKPVPEQKRDIQRDVGFLALAGDLLLCESAREDALRG